MLKEIHRSAEYVLGRPLLVQHFVLHLVVGVEGREQDFFVRARLDAVAALTERSNTQR
jgi:hypothetical protein